MSMNRERRVVVVVLRVAHRAAARAAVLCAGAVSVVLAVAAAGCQSAAPPEPVRPPVRPAEGAVRSEPATRGYAPRPRPSAPLTPAQQIGLISKRLASQLAADAARRGGGGDETLRIGILPFLDRSRQTGDFGRTLADTLTTDLFRTGTFQVIADRERMAKVLDELKIQEEQAAAMDKQTLKELGKLAGVAAIVDGTVTDRVSDFGVECQLIDIETGTLLAVGSELVGKRVLRSGRGSWSGAAHGRSTVAVLPFENRSGVRAPDRTGGGADAYCEAARGALADLVAAGGGCSVIDRGEVDAAAAAAAGQGAAADGPAGRTDRRTADVGARLGADLVVTGAVLDVSSDDRRSTVGRVQAHSTSAVARVAVRVVDVATGEVLFAGEYDGSQVVKGSRFAGVNDAGVAAALGRSAVRRAFDDPRFVAALSRPPDPTELYDVP